MQLKSLKNQLIATTGVSSLVAAGIIGWALWNSPALLPEMGSEALPPSTPNEQTVVAGTSKLSFEDVWNLELRGPKMANTASVAPPPTANTVVVPPTKFDIQLLGTMIEGAQSVGIFSDTLGGFDVKSAGENLELSPSGVRVSRIEPAIAFVSYLGQEIRLEIASVSPGTPTPSATTPQDSNLNMDAATSSNVPTASAPSASTTNGINYSGAAPPAPMQDTGDLSDPLPPGLDPASDFSGYQRALAPPPPPAKGPMQ